MKRQFSIIFLLFLIIPNLAVARRTLRVPGEYTYIQQAINAANNGDRIIVSQGIYRGSLNKDLDFHGKAITLQSAGINWDLKEEDVTPEQWQQYLALMQSIIANTIIDCEGGNDRDDSEGRRAMHRAFQFLSSESNETKVVGFTIINGYAHGLRGLDGEQRPEYPDECQDPLYDDQINDDDPLSPWRACAGLPAYGDGYGGAILLKNHSSPTIKHCVIKDSTVTGAQGGHGADGKDGPWTWPHPDPNIETPLETSDGQWGGHGGNAWGNGYGQPQVHRRTTGLATRAEAAMVVMATVKGRGVLSTTSQAANQTL
jgi:hypothetical protein